jgi:hypothetical protein
VSFPVPLGRDGIPLVSAAAARTDEGGAGGGTQVNQAVERSWTVLPGVTQRVVSGVVNVGCV